MTRDRDVRIPILSRMTYGKPNVPSNSQIFKKTLIVVAATFAIATIVAVMGSINAPVDVAATTAHAGEALTSTESYVVNVVDRKGLRGYGKHKGTKKDETAEAMRFANGGKWSETLQYRRSPPERRREANEDIMAQAADAAARAAVEVEIIVEATEVGAAETDAGATVTDAAEVWDGAWGAPCEEAFNDFNAGEAEGNNVHTLFSPYFNASEAEGNNVHKLFNPFFLCFRTLLVTRIVYAQLDPSIAR